MSYLGTQPNDVKKNTGLYTPSEILQLTKDGSWGGSLELIEEQSVTSTTATLDFTSIQENSYDVHLLQYKSFIPENDGVRLVLRFYENGVLETASVYQIANQIMRVTGTFSEAKSTGNAHIRVGTNMRNDFTSASDNGYIYIYNAGNSSKYTFATVQTTGIYYGDNKGAMEFGGGVLPQASLVNGFQLYGHSSGGIENIETKLYGVKTNMSNLRLINETEITSQTSSITVTDLFNEDFDIYKIVVDDINMNATAGIRGRIRFVNTSGSVVTSSNYDYAVQQLHSFQAFGENKATNGSTIDYFTIDIENTAEGNGGVIYIFNPYSSSSYTFLLFQTSFYNEGSGGQSQKGIGVLKQTSSIGGINFTAHSGDIDSLSLKTYGLRVDS